MASKIGDETYKDSKLGDAAYLTLAASDEAPTRQSIRRESFSKTKRDSTRISNDIKPEATRFVFDKSIS